MDPDIEVEVIHTSDPSRVTLGSRPVIIRGLPVGPCLWLWKDIDYLKSRIPEDKRVTVHVCPTSDMDFLKKNFLYKILSFHSFLDRCTSKEKLDNFFLYDNEKYYLRALGDDPRKEAAQFGKHFPELAPDVHIPNIFFKERLFSTVLRGGSAGVRLWTHYDIMDNILLQIVGRKTVVLFDPSDAPYLYLNGDKSEVINVDNPDFSQYPLFASATRYRASMVPGDILFIPALWFHNVVAEDFSLAVNAFWRSTAIRDDYYDAKDIYGNSDLIPAQRAFQGVEKAMKQLEVLPERYRRFYAFRCMELVRKKFSLPRDVFSCSDTSTDGPVMAEYSPVQAQTKPEIRNFHLVSTAAKDGGSPAMTSSSLFDTYSPLSSDSPFHGMSAVGQSHSPEQRPPVSTLLSSVPFCFSGPNPSPISGTYSPLGMTSYVPNVQSILPYTMYPPPSFMKSTNDFGLSSVDELLSPPQQASQHQRGRSTTGSTSAALGRGSQNAALSHGPPQREKKVLQFIDPSTGAELVTKSTLVSSKECSFGGAYEQTTNAVTIVHVSSAEVDRNISSAGDGDGTVQYVGLSKKSDKETEAAKVMKNAGCYSYSREVMDEISKLPASKIRPNFLTARWSSNNMAEVFVTRRVDEPLAKRRTRSRRKPPRFSAGHSPFTESGAQATVMSTGRKSNSPLSSAGGNERPGAKKVSFYDLLAGIPPTECGSKGESKTPPEEKASRACRKVDDIVRNFPAEATSGD